MMNTNSTPNTIATIRTSVRSPRSRVIGAIIIVVLAIPTSSAFLNSHDRPDADSPGQETDPGQDHRTAMPVNIIHAGDVSGPNLATRYTGRLVAKQQSHLSFERGGRITKVHVREGDVVAVGDLLAELDQEDLDAIELRTQSELAAQQARLKELIAGPRSQEIEAARAKADELAARVELAEIDARRQRKLATQGATSQSELDSAILGLQATRNSLVAAKAIHDQLVEGTRSEQIAAQRAKCAAIDASLKELHSNRNDSRIIAPFDGYIATRLLDEGAVIASGTPIVELMSDHIECEVGVPPEIAAKWAIGTEVTIYLGIETRRGWISRVEPMVRADSRTRRVFVDLGASHSSEAVSTASVAAVDNFETHTTNFNPSSWVPGEVIDLQSPGVAQSIAEDHFWLPVSSLLRGPRGLWNVLVIPGSSGDGVCQRRLVEVVKTDSSYSLVKGMLHPGERVVADGLHRITPGMMLSPLEPVHQDQAPIDQAGEQP